MVFTELIDHRLLALIDAAYQQGNKSIALYYTELLNSEQYHWDTIKNECPDSYDFLKTLEDRLHTMAHYQ